MINELKIRKWVFVVFSILWMGIIFIDYIDKHPIYWLSIVNFKYSFWLIVNVLLCLLIAAYGSGKLLVKKLGPPKINGLFIYVIFLFILNFTAFCFNQYLKADLNFAHYWHLTVRSSYTLLGGFILVLCTYSLGDIALRKIILNHATGITKTLSCIALGMYLLSLILFTSAALNILTNPVVLATLLIPIAINYKETLVTLKSWFWTPFQKPKNWTFWSFMILYFCLMFFTINFFYTQAPFPLGFDARNYYVNISQLLAQNNALIEGFQPYAWSLIASVGYIGFYSPEITLFLSTIGGLLTCWGIYELSNKYLGVKPDYALLAVITFLLTPAIINHWIIEFKVDLTLLFVQLAILNLLFYWMNHKDGMPLLKNRLDWNILILLSVLMGFSLSIKVLSVFLTFGVLLVFYFYHRDRIGMLGLACIGVSLPILLQLDSISGVRAYLDNPNLSAYIFSALGLGLMSYSIIKNLKTSSITTLKLLSTSSLIMLFSFSPWVIKNYAENPKASVIQLVLGKSPQPEINLSSIIRNYKR